jgi:hypothetical protein
MLLSALERPGVAEALVPILSADVRGSGIAGVVARFTILPHRPVPLFNVREFDGF